MHFELKQELDSLRNRIVSGNVIDNSYSLVSCMFFASVICLPGHKNKRKCILEITKMFYFYIQIIKILNKKLIK